MAKFESVRFGENTPVSYDKLNYMMLNDQYNKDELRKIPKGVLATYKTGIAVLAQNTPFNLSLDIPFTVDDSRLVKITVTCGTFESTVTGEIMNLSVQIDGIDVGPKATGVSAALSTSVAYGRPVAELAHIVSPALTKGTHTLDLVVSGKGAVGSLFSVSSPFVWILVEDIGPYIDGA